MLYYDEEDHPCKASLEDVDETWPFQARQMELLVMRGGWGGGLCDEVAVYGMAVSPQA